MKKWMKQLGILVVTFCTAWMLWGMDAKAEIALYTNGYFFDAAFYATAYPDVAAAVGTDPIALLTHYVSSGEAEGRLPYATYGTGISPVTGLPDLPLATEFRTNITAEDQQFWQYVYQAFQAFLRANPERYADLNKEFGSGVSLDMLTLSRCPKGGLKWLPTVRTDAAGNGPVVVSAAMLGKYPEFLYDWYLTPHDDQGTSTWILKTIHGDWMEDQKRFRDYNNIYSWDVLRNALRYISPDGEAVFRNVICGYFQYTSPNAPLPGNFYNIGSTLFICGNSDYPDEFYIRNNDLGLDMEAVKNVIPSQSIQVPLTRTKRTFVDVTDPYLTAYKNAYRPWEVLEKCGSNVLDPEDMDFYDFVDGDGLFTIFDDGFGSTAVYGNHDELWRLDYHTQIPDNGLKAVANSWVVEIPGYLSPLELDALHQSLRYVNPDAEALYAYILQNETSRNVPLNRWIKVGSSRLYVSTYYDRWYTYCFR